MATRQDKDKDKNKKSLRKLLKEKDHILVKYPEVVEDDLFADYRPPQRSELRDAYKKYNELLDEIERYVDMQGKGVSAFKPRG